MQREHHDGPACSSDATRHRDGRGRGGWGERAREGEADWPPHCMCISGFPATRRPTANNIRSDVPVVKMARGRTAIRGNWSKIRRYRMRFT